MEARPPPPPSPPPPASPSQQQPQPPVPEPPPVAPPPPPPPSPPPPAASSSLPQQPPPVPQSPVPQKPPPPVPRSPAPQPPVSPSPPQPSSSPAVVPQPPVTQPPPPVPQPTVTQPSASPSQPQPSPLPQPPEASSSQAQPPETSPPQPPEASPSQTQPQAPAASPSRLQPPSLPPSTSPLQPPPPPPPSTSPSQQPPPPSSQQLPLPTPPTTCPSPSTTPSTSITTTATPPLPPPIPTTTSVKSELPETAEPKQSISTPLPSTLTIPSYSCWFSFDSVHETERRAFPGFFDGRSSARTPKTYRYFRDSIVRLFWESPSRKITFTDARRRLVGDVGAIRRIFDFLELWGIINYVPSKTTPVAAEKSTTAAAAAAAAEEEKEKKTGKAAAVAEGEEQKVVRVRKVCTSCGSVCVQAGFASDKQVDVFLCSKCFVRGNYRGGLSSGDFKRVEVAEEGGKNVKLEWSEKETLHLLEAVLHYGDDWKKVAEHIGNGKTQKDCVARFVKLPFGEQFMGSLGAGQIGGDGWRKNVNGDLIDGENVEELHAAKRMHLTPLADASNPIMAQVAFLSAMVGSDVAEAAAKAAVEAMYNVDSSLRYTNYATNSNAIHSVGDGNNTLESGEAFEEAVGEARMLLEQEREDVEHSISDTIEFQMKEMQEKINHFEELELLVEKERSQVQYLKNVLFADQLSLLQQKAKYSSIESTRNNGPTST